MLIERVKRALAPDYEILEEIAGGGMGIVFAAHQRRLDRKVALKLLRPEQASAVAVERFVAEGKVLARLAHPSIIPIYDAGEADGLLYYVMEFVEGETLACRLSRGTLSRKEALGLAEDLLGALSAAHAAGVIHRDVKPSNIFLRNGRALLGDFGIARSRDPNAASYTKTGELIGTPRYMAPEQLEGLETTPRTDVYCAGLVLWEACTGTRWPLYQDPARGDWSKVPRVLASALRRALELTPELRWENASQFLAAIERAARRRARPLALLAATAILALAIAGYLLLRPRSVVHPRAALTLVIPPLGVSGGVDPALGDSVAGYLRDLLAGYPDWEVPAAGPAAREQGVIPLRGSVVPSAAGYRLSLAESGPVPAAAQRISLSASSAREQWQRAADSMAAALVSALYDRLEHDQFFAGGAIPPDPARRAQFVKAEQFFSLGQWEQAHKAYNAIVGTCLLCKYRSLDIARWFGMQHDSVTLRLLQRADSSFPEHYRPLLHALVTPYPARFDTLQQAAATWPGFYLISFEYADELFHRAPLFGRLRAEAIAPFEATVRLRPRFEPAWEHLAWLLISEGDRAGAKTALDTLIALPADSGLSAALVALRRLGYQWRFAPLDSARQLSRGLMQQPEIRANSDAAAAPRLLMTMDAPRGAYEMGGMYASWWEVRNAALPGLLGQLFGAAALGWLDSLPLLGARFARFPEGPAYQLLAFELEATLRAFDPDSSLREAAELRQELARAARRFAGDDALHPRAAWAIGILAAGRGDTATLAAARVTLRAQSSDPWLGRILEAAAVAPREPSRALGLLRDFPSLDREVPYADPLEDAVTHFLRASLEQRLDSVPSALRTLRWHEHSQIPRHLLGGPQAGELAWALGTLARWKRRELLDSLGVHEGSEWCNVNRGVARLWADAAPVFRARAAQAARDADSPPCKTAP